MKRKHFLYIYSRIFENAYLKTCREFSHSQYCSLEQYITPSGYLRHKAACKDTHVSNLLYM